MTNFEASDKNSGTTESVDWGAIIVGAAIALAISSIMFAFGSAVGLSLTSFAGRSSASFTALIAGAALWFLWVQVSSFAAGGYITGRLRRRSPTILTHESELRDGSHGLAVWAVAVVFAGLLATLLASSNVHNILQGVDAGYYADQLISSDTAKTGTAVTDASPIYRILSKVSANRALNDLDKTSLANAVVANSGLAPADAQRRVETVIAAMKSEADMVRKLGILLAFLTAASLLIGAVAAWWSAVAGAKHRFSLVDHSHLSSWR
jgi:hypothetical protein